MVNFTRVSAAKNTTISGFANHYELRLPEKEQPKLHNSNNSLINCHTFSNVFCRSSFPKFRQLFPFAFYMFVQGPLKQMDGKCLNGLSLWWDWLKSWKCFRFMIKIFEGISAGGISNFRGKLISSVICLYFISHGASTTTTYDDLHIFLWSSVKFTIFETFMGPKRYCRKTTTLRDFNAIEFLCTFKDITSVNIVQ